MSQLLGHLRGVDGRRLGKQQEKLLAAQARNVVAGAQQSAGGRGRGAQGLVTEGMTEAVIDLLEVIEVEQHHRQRAIVATRAASSPLDHFLGVAAVRGR